MEAARVAAGAMLRSSVDDIRQVASFAGNQVFRVRCADRVAFLKFADEIDLRREVAVLGVLGRLGVPVPIIESFDPAADVVGAPVALLRHVGGRPLRGDEPEFSAAGAHLRAIHEVRLDGFGPIGLHAGALRGADRTWVDTIRRRTSQLAPIADAGLVPAELLDRGVAVLDEHQGLFCAVGSGRLLHGDFHPRHVYAADGRITGIIDWGDATSGDPVYDLARVLHFGLLEDGLDHGFALVRVILAGYGNATWIESDLEVKLMLYAAVLIMWSMEGEFCGGAPWPPWWPAQAAALDLILDELARH